MRVTTEKKERRATEKYELDGMVSFRRTDNLVRQWLSPSERYSALRGRLSLVLKDS